MRKPWYSDHLHKDPRWDEGRFSRSTDEDMRLGWNFCALTREHIRWLICACDELPYLWDIVFLDESSQVIKLTELGRSLWGSSQKFRIPLENLAAWASEQKRSDETLQFKAVYDYSWGQWSGVEDRTPKAKGPELWVGIDSSESMEVSCLQERVKRAVASWFVSGQDSAL